MRTKKAKTVRMPSAKSDDKPATRKMLKLVRHELVQKMDAGFGRMEARFIEMDARFIEMDARFGQMDARFTRMESRFTESDSRFTQMQLKIEEQTANNRIVLEGLQALWQRQDRLEARVDNLKV